MYMYVIDTELYENIGQVSTNLKAYLVDGMRNMWQQLNEFARSHTSGQEQLQVTDSDMPLGESAQMFVAENWLKNFLIIILLCK